MTLLISLLKELVTFKDEVKIEKAIESGTTIYTVMELNQRDIGKIIGKQGNTIKALNTIFRAIHAARGEKCVIEISEQEKTIMNLDKLTKGERFLVEWQYHFARTFNKNLAETIALADTDNREKLAKGYPEEVEAYKRFANEDEYWQNVQKKAGIL